MVIGCSDRVYNRDRMEAIEVPFMIKTATPRSTLGASEKGEPRIAIQDRFSGKK